MNIFESIILGIIQGFTELLPVSSSGHLTLIQQFFDIQPAPVLFDVLLHLATLCAISFYFRHALLKLTREKIVKLSLASLPTLTIGFLFKDILLHAFNSTLIVGIGLLFYAAFNFSTENVLKKNNSVPTKKMTPQQNIIIGCCQTLALLPGVSRSGSTIFASLSAGLSKQEALEFSSLMAIPVVLAANGAELLEVQNISTLFANMPIFLFGAIAAFFTSLFSLKLLKNLLNHKRFDWFGWYCLIAGLATITISLF